MSTTTHDFQIGQRVVVANPPANALELAGRAGMYFGHYRDGRVLVRLDVNRCTYAVDADALEPEPRAVQVTLTEPEAKRVLAILTVRLDESGELLQRAVRKLQHALPHPEA